MFIVFLLMKSLLKEKRFTSPMQPCMKKGSSAKKTALKTRTAESSKTMGQQQKRKLVVRFAEKPEPFKVKVKSDREKVSL